jgi:hypothetical protein
MRVVKVKIDGIQMLIKQAQMFYSQSRPLIVMDV